MPFLAPLAAPLIMGGASVASSAIGSKLSKANSNPLEQQVLGSNLSGQKTALGAGQNLIGMGTNAMQQPLNYWSSIMSGNRGQATSAMAPEIGRIGQGYQQASQTSAALNPRGGPSASFLGELPFRQQQDVTSLLQGARPQAAGQLAGAGQSLLSGGIQSIIGSTAAGRDILTQQQNLRQLESERGKAIGGGIFDIIQKYGFPALDDWLKKMAAKKSAGGGGLGGLLGGGLPEDTD